MSRRPRKKATEPSPHYASEELYQTLFEQAADGIFIAEAQGRFVEVNRRGCEMLGYTHKEMLNLSLPDVIPTEELAHDPLQLDELRTGKTILKERHLRSKDGRLLPVEINARMLADGNFLGIVRDITERKQAEEALRESEQLFRALVENSPDFIARYDREFRRIYVNPAIQKLFGEAPENVLNKTPAEQSPVYAPQVYIDQLRQVIETATERAVEMPFRTAQGEMHWGHMRFVPEFGPDGQVVSVLAIGRDVHEIKENERRFRMLAENFPDFVVRFDRNCRYTYVNPTVEKAFGMPAEAFLGKTLHELPQQPKPEQNDTLMALIRRAFDEGVTNNSEVHWDTQMGKRIFEIRHVPEKDATGNVVTVLGIAYDITERKQAEKERQDHLHFLESMDQVNRAMQGTNDLDQMMSDVLNLALSVFECDRAVLTYPCDPEAPTWSSPMERTRPEYPGILELGQVVPMDPEVAGILEILLNSSGPVRFGPESEYSLASNAEENFSVKSFLGVAIYPKVDKPWLFGIHQCSYPRVWTPQEVRLFQEIGRRLADTLTSLLTYRQLQESEERYRLIAENTVDTIRVFDLNLKPAYVSPSVLKLRGYTVEEAMTQSLDQVLTPESLQKVKKVFAEQLALEASETADPGRTVLLELEQYRKDGSIIWVELAASALRDNNLQPTGILTVSRDITKRKQAEDELRQNREAALQFSEQLAALQEVTNKLSKSESSDDLCLLAVQLGRSRLGFDRVSIWFIEEHLSIMRGSFGTDEHGELRDERDAQVEFRHEGLAWRLFSHNEPMALVERCPLRDHLGREVGEGDNASAALWDGNEVIGVIFVDNLFSQHPITENQLEVLRLYATTLGHLITRKQAEEALRASEARFRTFVDHAADAFYLHDDRGTILDVNRQACESLGYSREELIGMTPHDFDVGSVRSFIDQINARLDAGEMPEFDTRHRRKDGTVFPVEVRTRPFWEGERRFGVSLARDITERKRAEEALRESEERLRQIASSLREVIWLRDVQTRQVLYVNPAFEELTGRTCESFYENRDIVVDAIHPDDKEEVIKALEQRFEGVPFDKEHRIIHLDGSVRWVSSRIFPVRNEAGEIYRSASIMEDITERKQAEAEIRQLNQELEQRVANRTAQLEAANKELESFAYSVSHDLRAPLRHIDGFLELLQKSTAATLDERSRHYMDTITGSARRMSQLIDDLLAFSRMGRFELAKTSVDLGVLVQDIIQELEPETQGRTVHWHMAELPTVTGDRAMLRQVLVNLISNALKFSRERSPADIEIGGQVSQKETIIFVRDNGVGFDMAYAGKLFGVFQRLHRADEFEGTGIGLATVRRIIRRHGGRTWAEGKVNQGATFYFSLPQPVQEASP